VIRPFLALVGTAVAAALILGACERGPAPSGRLPVVASVYPLYEFTRQVAGSAARVTSLVPPGVEPHDWEPSPRDVTEMRNARLFVYNGAGLDPWVAKLAGEAATSRVVLVRATEGIALLTSASAATATPDGAAPDPHVWLDPVLAQSMVETIRAALAKVDAARADAYADNARTFVAKLQRLHEQYQAGLAHCARREVVTAHAALGYLAHRYGLVLVPILGLSPEAEPTPARLASIVRFARERKVQYIFFETLVGPRLAEALAREVGARTLIFDPIEGVSAEAQAAGTSYTTLMEGNLNNLRLALDCR